MKRRPRWTDAQLQEAVPKSNSMRELMTLLGLAPIGGNYGTVQKHLTRLGLNTEHFMTQREQMEARGHLGVQGRLTVDEALARFRDGIPFTNGMRRRLAWFKDASKCAVCSTGREWNGAPLVLQVDHINGCRTDNRLENLRFICPNCHSQTDTFAGKRFRNKPAKQHRKERPLAV